ncbi:hypothetical protein KXW98_005604 [Aspergillus fumigatus]|nr:hypothetical protein KXX47_008165 [Aspergillus fumigatus]KAH1386918.1 hypothetical protein KXX10_003637 [Aspergillus fumigatus]KAH1458102.1 hypothetical protein KXX58_009541 [Aspergillus fumigatus]KAH1492030.1 hypothetical protein KXX52_004395 [Aspergillus fumigatus]KAH1606935.1 hypothetical protein KXX44_000119 [Aspergillus fumigatus]
MAFQISIGDVLMLSKLAWDITQAFTSGRKSAPAEFQEVQNQLSSLTHALESLKSLSGESPGLDDGASASSIAPILQNCRFTLEHLDALVKKYMIIENDGTGGPEKKRWRDEIRKNWKKVRWTREGGDLTRLQHNLGVHINSLNLTIAVLNSEINQGLGQRVENVHEMLGEIYAWFTSNLKGRTASFYEPSSRPQERPPELSFSLHRADSEPFHTVALCDNASFNVDWLQVPTQPVFKCNCQLRRTRYGDIHDEELIQYLLSPMTLIVRLNGRSQTWKMWLSSSRTSRLTCLIIRDINPSKLAIFDDVISDLGIAMTRQAFHRGTASLMVSPSINPYTGLSVVSVLNMLCDASQLYNTIENVKLTANGHSYSTGPIEAVQLVHYRNLTGDGAWVFNESADAILAARLDPIPIDSTEHEASEFTVTVASQTHISHGESGSVVRISEADCLSRTKSGQQNMVKTVDVEIELTDMNSANYLVQQLKGLQEGLLLFKIQQMLRNERIIFSINLGTLMVYDYHITDALLTLVVNLETKEYRMLIANASRSIHLSVELSAEALQKSSGLDRIYIPCDGPVWVAECNLDATLVYQQRSRSALICTDGHAQQLLILLLRSVARGDHGITYPIFEGRRYNELEG